MNIKVLSKMMFRKLLNDNNITTDNIEQVKDTFFISINNPDDKLIDLCVYEDKENLKIMFFPDIEQDREIPIIGTGGKTALFKAMTQEQADELFEFINKHKDKKNCIVHCTAGISRSGAIGLFINEFMLQKYNEFKRENPTILPNFHVYRLLHESWYKSHSHNDSITGERLRIENDTFDNKTIVHYPDGDSEVVHPKIFAKESLEEAIKNQYPGQEVSKVYLMDEIGKTEPMRGYKKGPTELIGARFVHPDGSSTFVKAVDPYRLDGFEQFWLETPKFYGMVEESEMELLAQAHPNFNEIMGVRKKMYLQSEFEPFAQFGVGEEYTGILLEDWLTANGMIGYFKK